MWVAGRRRAVDAQGNFVAEAMLPPGMHTVEVAVLDAAGQRRAVPARSRAREERLVLRGHRRRHVVDRTTAAARPTCSTARTRAYDSDSSLDGRIAFYVTGKFDERLEADRQRRHARRADLGSVHQLRATKHRTRCSAASIPDYHYPTFGDDGTVDEVAPTNGKFYVKADQRREPRDVGQLQGRLPRQRARAGRPRSVRRQRATTRRSATTSYGEQRLALDGFGAEPGTVPSREEFRGTDGSLYFLRHQDILMGSERLRIEVRDKVSGLVTGVVHLRPTSTTTSTTCRAASCSPSRSARRSPTSCSSATGAAATRRSRRALRVHARLRRDRLAGGGRPGALWFNDCLKVGLTATQRRGRHRDSSL